MSAKAKERKNYAHDHNQADDIDYGIHFGTRVSVQLIDDVRSGGFGVRGSLVLGG